MASADEWEYEYDENETEDFYIPLDLSNVPNAQIPVVSQGRPGHPTLLKSRLRALNAARGQPSDMAMDTSDGQETATMGEVQIVGLHTSNPLVMYNGELLSCQWTSTIGTDMFFVKPSAHVGDLSQPLRSLPSVDLLSVGSAKLVAKVGRLRPRDDLFKGPSDAQLGTESTNVSPRAQDVYVEPSQAVSENVQSSSQHVRPASTSFLARLNQAKAKRGDVSRLAIARSSDATRLVSEDVGEERTRVSDPSSQPLGDTAMGGT